jgi:Fe2+ transport system protein FeoA
LEATLADIPPGDGVELRGFAPGLPQERRAHLQAYGLVPGRFVRVLQHNPVTVVQVEHCEIALEDDLACQICVAQTPN